MAKITKARLAEMIDELGELKDKLKPFADAERLAAKALREAMEACGVAAATGAQYAATLETTRTLDIDPVAFKRKAKPAVFVECLKIDNRAARKHFEEAELEKISKLSISTRLRIEEIKPPRKLAIQS